MAGKRPWRLWIGRWIQELNGTSGLAGLGGLCLAIVSFMGGNASSDKIAAFTGWLGIVITLVAIGIAACRAIPPKFRHPTDLVSQRLTLDKLNTINPPLFKLGVVGPEMVGKTTLVNRILQQVPPCQRTQGVHAYVTALQTSPMRYLAMLDGPGQMYADQFEIASHANILCIILDHHSSDSEKRIDENRIQSHMLFQEQLRGYLAKQPRKPICIHLLLNKQDLWDDNSVPTAEKEKLRRLLFNEERKWQDSNLIRTVTSAEYSNRSPNDVAILMNQIRDFLRE